MRARLTAFGTLMFKVLVANVLILTALAMLTALFVVPMLGYERFCANCGTKRPPPGYVERPEVPHW